MRAAMAIQRQLARRRPISELQELPCAAFKRCERAFQLLELAHQRGWQAAAIVCRDRIRWALEDLRRQVEASHWELCHMPTAGHVSLREIFEDLDALEGEFDQVRVDLKRRQIGATTHPIQLDGVYLGSFEIVLDWGQLGHSSSCYEVIALDPHPAAADSSVSHPHARDNQLCEGEASSAIRAALGSGRLLDFFTIVARTLETYNGESAFVSLDRWSGSPCADCGGLADEVDSCECTTCERDVCSNCGSSCARCGRTNCNACSWNCTACSDASCETCLIACACCGEDYCERCLNDGQCSKCRDSAAEGEDDQPVTAYLSTTGAPDAPANAVCLEQTVILA
jgi:hypothetical protein